MKLRKKEFIAFAAPSMITMIVLMIIPLIVTLFLSFCTFQLGGSLEFIGFGNYVNVFENPRFWNSTGFTLLVTFINVPARLLIGMGLAIILYNVKSRIFTTIFISGILLPFVITPAVSTQMFSWLFKDIYGLFPHYLSEMGINIQWFADVIPARALITFHTIWSGVPFVIITLYAGLQAMPVDPLKAAQVEGASWPQKIRHILIPYLSPLILFTTMINIMDIYRLYDSVAIMTKGGPAQSTETIQFYNYQVAFQNQSLGQAASISVLTVISIFILMMPFLFIMYREQAENKK